MNERLIATGAMVDTSERHFRDGSHSWLWAAPIIGVAVAGLALAILGAHGILGTIVSVLP